jgi:hypothetical protein
MIKVLQKNIKKGARFVIHKFGPTSEKRKKHPDSLKTLKLQLNTKSTKGKEKVSFEIPQTFFISSESK